MTVMVRSVCVRAFPPECLKMSKLRTMTDHALHIVHVHVHVKPEVIGDFAAATVDNARASVREPGCLRFDVLRSEAEPTRFVLVEVYRDAAAAAAHKQTAHYAAWRDRVADMMAEPRSATKFTSVFPDDAAGFARGV